MRPRAVISGKVCTDLRILANLSFEKILILNSGWPTKLIVDDRLNSIGWSWLDGSDPDAPISGCGGATSCVLVWMHCANSFLYLNGNGACMISAEMEAKTSG